MSRSTRTGAALGLPKNRLDAMSDAIFGVAMTLLALELRIAPGLPAGSVTSEIAGMGPRFWTFFLTFAFIAVVWIYLQHFQHLMLRYDLVTITLSLLASAGIILLPFTSSTAASYPGVPAAQRLFALNFAAIIGIYGINTLYSIRRDVPAVVSRRLLYAFAAAAWSCFVYVGVFVPILVSYRPAWGIPAVAVMVVAAFSAICLMHPHFSSAYEEILNRDRGSGQW